MLAGRWAVPVPNPAAHGNLPLGGLSPSAPLVFNLRPGDVHIERLAADLTWSGRPPRWVCLAPYDLDRPALDALAAATLDGTGLTGGTAGSGDLPVVVESNDRRQAERFLSRLAAAEPGAPPPCAVVLRYVQPGKDRRRTTPTRGAMPPPARNNDALERLTRGRLALHDSLLDAGRRLRPGELADIVERSSRLGDLTTRLAVRLLQDVPPRTTTLLDFVALLGYCSRRFGSLDPVLDACGDLPWWTDLTSGWRRFDPAWRDAIHAVCRSDQQPQAPLLGRLVCELVEDGAVEAAMELSLDAGCAGTASDLLAGFGPDMIAGGRPLSVRRWLRRLPRAMRRRHRALAVQIRAALRAAVDAPTVRHRRSRGRPIPAEPKPAVGRERPDVTRPVDGPSHPVTVSALTLEARLLGPMDVSVGGQRVEHWRGRKGALLLAYLLLHRGRPVPRDALTVTFWPEAPSDASRNRLHVTLHALRADLQAASALPVVVFRLQDQHRAARQARHGGVRALCRAG